MLTELFVVLFVVGDNESSQLYIYTQGARGNVVG
jgi:hypothetical protein